MTPTTDAVHKAEEQERAAEERQANREAKIILLICTIISGLVLWLLWLFGG